LPASRFLCEHLLQNLFRACISRIHAQVPVVTTGQLAKAFRQQPWNRRRSDLFLLNRG